MENDRKHDKESKMKEQFQAILSQQSVNCDISRIRIFRAIIQNCITVKKVLKFGKKQINKFLLKIQKM